MKKKMLKLAIRYHTKGSKEVEVRELSLSLFCCYVSEIHFNLYCLPVLYYIQLLTYHRKKFLSYFFCWDMIPLVIWDFNLISSQGFPMMYDEGASLTQQALGVIISSTAYEMFLLLKWSPYLGNYWVSSAHLQDFIQGLAIFIIQAWLLALARFIPVYINASFAFLVH